MLRIGTPMHQDGHTTLRLDGDISGTWVGILDSECEKVIAAGHTAIRLDLRHVNYVDPEGRALLRRLVLGGTVLLNCSPVIEAQLREEASG